MSDTAHVIEALLRKTFQPEFISITDESYKHEGHAGAREGGGHYIVEIVSDKFSGASRLQRQRMVNSVVKDLFNEKKVHALSIQARAPEELN